MMQLYGESGAPFWDTRNSGTIPQSSLDSTIRYANDPSLFTTDAEIDADAPTGPMSSFPGHVNSPEEALWQSLGSLPDTHQGASADNSLLPGFIPSASDIPVHHELDSSLRALLEVQSLTALFQDALNAPVPMVQHGPGRNDTHAISGVDENALTAPTVAQMHGHMPPLYSSQMPEEQTLAHLKQVQTTHTSFPTLSTFTPLVSGLLQWPLIQPNQYYSLQPLASGPWPLNNDFYDPLAAPNPLVWGIGQPNEVYPTHPIYPGQSTHSQMAGPMHVYPDTADYTSMLAVPYSRGSCATQSLSGNVVLPLLAHPPYDTKVDNWHTPSKRKADEDIGAVDAGPSPPPVCTNVSKRRRVESIIIEGNEFGAYAEVDANATVMPKPLSDHHPVDICDVDGAGTGRPQTRKYGVMEIDDSYGNRSARISKELPIHLTCVRACQWVNHPCGLYIEVCKDRISDHLFKWHGVAQDVKTPCEFQGCDGKSLKTLGRHIETVHFGTSWECSFCHKGLSRSDAVTRHRKKCEGALAGHTL